MPAFDTPEPVRATVEVVVGDVRITASDRTDTVVRVRPSDAGHEPDVRAAEQTRVEFDAGGLLVRAPRQRGLGLSGKAASIDVTIELPAGSQVHADCTMTAFHTVGRLGECRVKNSAGDISIDQADAVELTTGAGTITVERAGGHAEIKTGTGRVRLREAASSAAIRNSNGDSWIGEIAGELRVHAANGDISVGRAGTGVTASTSTGDLRVGELTSGGLTLKTSIGQIEVGIRAGTAAQLDVSTKFGRVLNQLDSADSPSPSDQIAAVHARTSYGDIVLRRS